MAQEVSSNYVINVIAELRSVGALVAELGKLREQLDSISGKRTIDLEVNGYRDVGKLYQDIQASTKKATGGGTQPRTQTTRQRTNAQVAQERVVEGLRDQAMRGFYQAFAKQGIEAELVRLAQLEQTANKKVKAIIRAQRSELEGMLTTLQSGRLGDVKKLLDPFIQRARKNEDFIDLQSSSKRYRAGNLTARGVSTHARALADAYGSKFVELFSKELASRFDQVVASGAGKRHGRGRGRAGVGATVDGGAVTVTLDTGSFNLGNQLKPLTAVINSLSSLADHLRPLKALERIQWDEMAAAFTRMADSSDWIRPGESGGGGGGGSGGGGGGGGAPGRGTRSGQMAQFRKELQAVMASGKASAKIPAEMLAALDVVYRDQPDLIPDDKLRGQLRQRAEDRKKREEEKAKRVADVFKDVDARRRFNTQGQVPIDYISGAPTSTEEAIARIKASRARAQEHKAIIAGRMGRGSTETQMLGERIPLPDRYDFSNPEETRRIRGGRGRFEAATSAALGQVLPPGTSENIRKFLQTVATTYRPGVLAEVSQPAPGLSRGQQEATGTIRSTLARLIQQRPELADQLQWQQGGTFGLRMGELRTLYQDVRETNFKRKPGEKNAAFFARVVKFVRPLIAQEIATRDERARREELETLGGEFGLNPEEVRKALGFLGRNVATGAVPGRVPGGSATTTARLGRGDFNTIRGNQMRAPGAGEDQIRALRTLIDNLVSRLAEVQFAGVRIPKPIDETDPKYAGTEGAEKLKTAKAARERKIAKQATEQREFEETARKQIAYALQAGIRGTPDEFLSGLLSGKQAVGGAKVAVPKGLRNQVGGTNLTLAEILTYVMEYMTGPRVKQADGTVARVAPDEEGRKALADDITKKRRKLAGKKGKQLEEDPEELARAQRRSGGLKRQLQGAEELQRMEEEVEKSMKPLVSEFRQLEAAIAAVDEELNTLRRASKNQALDPDSRAAAKAALREAGERRLALVNQRDAAGRQIMAGMESSVGYKGSIAGPSIPIATVEMLGKQIAAALAATKTAEEAPRPKRKPEFVEEGVDDLLEQAQGVLAGEDFAAVQKAAQNMKFDPVLQGLKGSEAAATRDKLKQLQAGLQQNSTLKAVQASGSNLQAVVDALQVLSAGPLEEQGAYRKLITSMGMNEPGVRAPGVEAMTANQTSAAQFLNKYGVAWESSQSIPDTESKEYMDARDSALETLKDSGIITTEGAKAFKASVAEQLGPLLAPIKKEFQELAQELIKLLEPVKATIAKTAEAKAPDAVDKRGVLLGLFDKNPAAMAQILGFSEASVRGLSVEEMKTQLTQLGVDKESLRKKNPEQLRAQLAKLREVPEESLRGMSQKEVETQFARLPDILAKLQQFEGLKQESPTSAGGVLGTVKNVTIKQLADVMLAMGLLERRQVAEEENKARLTDPRLARPTPEFVRRYGEAEQEPNAAKRKAMLRDLDAEVYKYLTQMRNLARQGKQLPAEFVLAKEYNDRLSTLRERGIGSTEKLVPPGGENPIRALRDRLEELNASREEVRMSSGGKGRFLTKDKLARLQELDGEIAAITEFLARLRSKFGKGSRSGAFQGPVEITGAPVDSTSYYGRFPVTDDTGKPIGNIATAGQPISPALLQGLGYPDQDKLFAAISTYALGRRRNAEGGFAATTQITSEAAQDLAAQRSLIQKIVDATIAKRPFPVGKKRSGYYQIPAQELRDEGIDPESLARIPGFRGNYGDAPGAVSWKLGQQGPNPLGGTLESVSVSKEGMQKALDKIVQPALGLGFDSGLSRADIFRRVMDPSLLPNNGVAAAGTSIIFEALRREISSRSGAAPGTMSAIDKEVLAAATGGAGQQPPDGPPAEGLGGGADNYLRMILEVTQKIYSEVLGLHATTKTQTAKRGGGGGGGGGSRDILSQYSEAELKTYQAKYQEIKKLEAELQKSEPDPLVRQKRVQDALSAATGGAVVDWAKGVQGPQPSPAIPPALLPILARTEKDRATAEALRQRELKDRVGASGADLRERITPLDLRSNIFTKENVAGGYQVITRILRDEIASIGRAGRSFRGSMEALSEAYTEARWAFVRYGAGSPQYQKAQKAFAQAQNNAITGAGETFGVVDQLRDRFQYTAKPGENEADVRRTVQQHLDAVTALFGREVAGQFGKSGRLNAFTTQTGEALKKLEARGPELQQLDEYEKMRATARVNKRQVAMLRAAGVQDSDPVMQSATAAVAMDRETMKAQEAKLGGLRSVAGLRKEYRALVTELLRSAEAMSKFAVGTAEAGDKLIQQESLLERVRRAFRQTLLYSGAGLFWFNMFGAIREAVRMTNEFELALRKVQGILGSRSESQREAIRDSVYGLSTQFGVSPLAALENVKVFSQAGFSGERSVAATQASIQAQLGADLTTEQAQELLVAMENITEGAVNFENILDRIARVESSRAVSAQDLALSLQRVGSLANQLFNAGAGLRGQAYDRQGNPVYPVTDSGEVQAGGAGAVNPRRIGRYDFADLVIGLTTAVVERTRITGNQAATGLRFILSRLAAPEITRTLQSRYNIPLAVEGSGGRTMRPLIDILQNIADEYKRLKLSGQTGAAAGLLQTVAGARQINTATAIFEHFDDVLSAAAESASAFGDTTARTALVMDSLSQQTARFKATFQEFMGRLLVDTGFARVAKNIVGFGADATQEVSKAPGLNVLGFAGLLGAIAFGFGKAQQAGARRYIAAGGGGEVEQTAGDISGAIWNRGGPKQPIPILSGASTQKALGTLATTFQVAAISALVGGVLALMGQVYEKYARERDKRNERQNPEPFNYAAFQKTEFYQQFQKNTGEVGTTISGSNNAVLDVIRGINKDLPAGTSYAQLVETFTDRLSSAIPGLNNIKDATERTNRALELLNASLVYYSAEVTKQAELVGGFVEEDYVGLTGQIGRRGLAAADGSDRSFSKVVSDWITGSRDVLATRGTNIRKELQEAIDANSRAGKYGLNGPAPTEQALVRSKLNELLPNFGAMLERTTVRGGSALDRFTQLLQDNTRTLGQALDELATSFTLTANEQAQVRDAERQIRQALSDSKDYVGKPYTEEAEVQRQLAQQFQGVPGIGQKLADVQALRGAIENELRRKYDIAARDLGMQELGPQLVGGGQGAAVFINLIEEVGKTLVEGMREGGGLMAKEVRDMLKRMESAPRLAERLAIPGARQGLRDLLLDTVAGAGTELQTIYATSKYRDRLGLSKTEPEEILGIVRQQVRNLTRIPFLLTQQTVQKANQVFGTSADEALSAMTDTDAEGNARQLSRFSYDRLAAADQDKLRMQFASLQEQLRVIVADENIFKDLPQSFQDLAKSLLTLDDSLAPAVLSLEAVKELFLRVGDVMRKEVVTMQRFDAAQTALSNARRLEIEVLQDTKVRTAALGDQVASVFGPRAVADARKTTIEAQRQSDLARARETFRAATVRGANELPDAYQTRVGSAQQELLQTEARANYIAQVGKDFAELDAVLQELNTTLTQWDSAVRESARGVTDVVSSYDAFKAAFEGIGNNKSALARFGSFLGAVGGPVVRSARQMTAQNLETTLVGPEGALRPLLRKLLGRASGSESIEERAQRERAALQANILTRAMDPLVNSISLLEKSIGQYSKILEELEQSRLQAGGDVKKFTTGTFNILEDVRPKNLMIGDAKTAEEAVNQVLSVFTARTGGIRPRITGTDTPAHQSMYKEGTAFDIGTSDLTDEQAKALAGMLALKGFRVQHFRKATNPEAYERLLAENRKDKTKGITGEHIHIDQQMGAAGAAGGAFMVNAPGGAEAAMNAAMSLDVKRNTLLQGILTNTAKMAGIPIDQVQGAYGMGQGVAPGASPAMQQALDTVIAEAIASQTGNPSMGTAIMGLGFTTKAETVRKLQGQAYLDQANKQGWLDNLQPQLSRTELFYPGTLTAPKTFPLTNPEGEKNKGKGTTKQTAKEIANTIGFVLGSQLGGMVSGGSQAGQFTSGMGAMLGQAAGTEFLGALGAFGGPVGAIAGGLLGGLIGSIFGGNEPEIPVSPLERIERNTSETVEAIENQTGQLLSLESRLLNVPATFSVPSYRPMSYGSGTSAPAGSSTTVNANMSFVIQDARDPNAVAKAVTVALKDEMRRFGLYDSAR